MAPDICMCQDDACPSRETCFRYKAKPYSWQAWSASFAANRAGRDECDSYWPVEKEAR